VPLLARPAVSACRLSLRGRASSGTPHIAIFSEPSKRIGVGSKAPQLGALPRRSSGSVLHIIGCLRCSSHGLGHLMGAGRFRQNRYLIAKSKNLQIPQIRKNPKNHLTKMDGAGPIRCGTVLTQLVLGDLAQSPGVWPMARRYQRRKLAQDLQHSLT
jgi:hypothetical protein